MLPIQVRIPEKLIEMIDKHVNKGLYSNRSELIRDAIRRHIEESR